MENNVSSIKLANSLKNNFSKNNEKILWLKVQGGIQISILLTFVIGAYYFNVKNYNYTIDELEYNGNIPLVTLPISSETPSSNQDTSKTKKPDSQGEETTSTEDIPSSNTEDIPSWKYKKIGFLMGIVSMVNIFSIIVMVVLLKNYRHLRTDIKNLQSEQDNFDKIISLLESQEFNIKLPDEIFLQRLFIHYGNNIDKNDDGTHPDLPPEVFLLLKEVLSKYMK